LRVLSVTVFWQEPVMSLETTLSIIKPDGVRRNLVGQILARIEEKGLRVAATKMVHLTTKQARQFYEVHKERPFYGELVDSMTSGPVVVSVLQGPNAIAAYRDVMGATNPAQAAPGTIRKDFALSIGENTVHGSDAPETARQEVSFFFARADIPNME
jgi:nucleoside-diphosphate kinase